MPGPDGILYDVDFVIERRLDVDRRVPYAEPYTLQALIDRNITDEWRTELASQQTSPRKR